MHPERLIDLHGEQVRRCRDPEIERCGDADISRRAARKGLPLGRVEPHEGPGELVEALQGDPPAGTQGMPDMMMDEGLKEVQMRGQEPRLRPVGLGGEARREQLSTRQ